MLPQHIRYESAVHAAATVDHMPLGVPDYFSHERSSLRKLIAGLNHSVLELGCASGKLAASLVESGQATAVDGIEFNSSAAAAAEGTLRKVYCADLNTFDFEVLEAQYDVLVAADVLEHLIDPWRVLRSAIDRVQPGGQVIASVPNVRYHKVIADLIFRGDFRYTPSGVLDRTHLRFFTRKTVRQLFSGSGLTEIEVLPADSGRTGLKRLLFFFLGDFGHPQLYIRAIKPPTNTDL